jgi:glutaredoxin
MASCPTCIALRALLQSVGVESSTAEAVSQAPVILEADAAVKKRVKRKLSPYDRALKKALRQVNDTVRTKKGALRKGVTQADVMRRAHRLARKMMK